MADTLYGTGVPSFYTLHSITLVGVTIDFPCFVILPHPATTKEYFQPDDIGYKYSSGKRDAKIRGLYLYSELYWDKLTYAQTLQLQQICTLSRESTLYFKPHWDYSRSYKVTANEQEGWNFDFVLNKYTNGYEGTLIIRGTEWLSGYPTPKPTGTVPRFQKVYPADTIPVGGIV